MGLEMSALQSSAEMNLAKQAKVINTNIPGSIYAITNFILLYFS